MYRTTDDEDRSIVVVAINGQVAGIDRRTGAEVWRNKMSGGGFGAVDLEVAQGRVFVSASGAALFCLDYKTGRDLWSARTSATGRSTILLDGEQVFVAKQGHVDCFDLHGNRLWSQPLGGMGLGCTAVGLPGNVRQADSVSSS